MKLYNVPNNTLVKVLPQLRDTKIDNPSDENVKVPVDSPIIQINEYIHFGHIDGMYSLCRNMEDEIVHLAAWTEVEPVEWSYKNMALLRTIIKRGGSGKSGKEDLKWVRTDEMSDEWVKNCIIYEQEHRPTNGMIEFYKWELKYRKKHGISVTE